MAFGGGGGANKAMSNINVTPLVDIVLVMLIIFLVTMPIVLRKIDIDVPKKIDEPIESIVLPDQVTVEITKNGIVLLNGIETPRQELASKLRDKLEHKREKIVFVDFDEGTRYGEAVQVMDTCKGAGATTVAIKMKDAYGPAPGTPGAPGAPGTPGAPTPAPAPSPTP